VKINGRRERVKKNVIGSVKIVFVDGLIFPKWEGPRANSMEGEGSGL
jgi:hypothetical protein